jgi:hypothetical protein
MERAAQGPGANDRTVGDGSFDGILGCGAGAQPDRPERAQVVLGLDRAEPADGRGRTGERMMTDALLAQALGGESDGESSDLKGARSLPGYAGCTGFPAGILRLLLPGARPYNPAAAYQ